MKKLIALTMVLILLISMAACGSNNENETKLGTSAFSIILPEGYEKTDDDYDEDQIAYYYKDDESIDFDVYQWQKDGKYTLEAEAEYFANEYGTSPEATEINGINVFKYVSEEKYDGFSYTVVNYMFEDESSIVEICFWTVNTDEEYAAVNAIINTLKKN